jgi:hypothetical protein
LSLLYLQAQFLPTRLPILACMIKSPECPMRDRSLLSSSPEPRLSPSTLPPSKSSKASLRLAQKSPSTSRRPELLHGPSSRRSPKSGSSLTEDGPPPVLCSREDAPPKRAFQSASKPEMPAPNISSDGNLKFPEQSLPKPVDTRLVESRLSETS